MAKVTVLFEQQKLIFEIPNGTPVYFELKKQGFDLPHGCLAGACGSCRVEVLEGIQNCVQASVVEQDTLNSLHRDWIKNNIQHDISKIRLACRLKVSSGEITICHFKG